jgi:hypothetical protein
MARPCSGKKVMEQGETEYGIAKVKSLKKKKKFNKFAYALGTK